MLREGEGLRGDYRDLIELVIFSLGGILPGGIRFHAPGPTYMARWMSKVIYSLKVWMLRNQFHLTETE